MDLGLTIRKLMEDKNISQTALGKLLGMKPQGIQSYLTNNAVPPLPKIKLMCEIFGVSADVFINGDVKPLNNNLTGSNSDDKKRIADLEKDKEFLMGIIRSKMFQDAPGEINFPKGSRNEIGARIIAMYPESASQTAIALS